MSAGGGTGGRSRSSSPAPGTGTGIVPGSGNYTEPTDTSNAINAGSPFAPISESAQQQPGGSTLGAALLNLDTQESAPGGAGGLDLYARQQREINRLKSRVAVVEQVLVV
jgi:hypothetical protein